MRLISASVHSSVILMSASGFCSTNLHNASFNAFLLFLILLSSIVSSHFLSNYLLLYICSLFYFSTPARFPQDFLKKKNLKNKKEQGCPTQNLVLLFILRVILLLLQIPLRDLQTHPFLFFRNNPLGFLMSG